MRKLKPIEIIALTALMSVGQNADAQSAEESLPVNLATITAVGPMWTTYYVPSWQDIYWSEGPPYSLSNSPLRPNKPKPTTATQNKAKNCVLQYGEYPVLGTGWSLNYSSQWGFRNVTTGEWSFPDYYTAPTSGGPWMEIYGTTRPIGGVDNRVTIFQLGYGSFDDLVNTLAHEFAHTWGEDEAGATAVGDAAEAAFKADNGAKCGGR